MKRYSHLLIYSLVLLLALSACTPKPALESSTEAPSTAEATDTQSTTSEEKGGPMSHPNVTIHVSLDGKALDPMVLELYPEKAKNTVNNFIALAQDHYYDGLIFHRIIEGFMIQGGDPTGTGTGGPGYGILGEFSGNGVDNDLKHERGVISMARSQMPNSAGSQFFICHDDAFFLDGQYAAFGKLVDGFDSLDALATTPTKPGDRPKAEAKMTSVEVDLNGYEAEAPKTIK